MKAPKALTGNPALYMLYCAVLNERALSNADPGGFPKTSVFGKTSLLAPHPWIYGNDLTKQGLNYSIISVDSAGRDYGVMAN
jgi:hypothetical protein